MQKQLDLARATQAHLEKSRAHFEAEAKAAKAQLAEIEVKAAKTEEELRRAHKAEVPKSL